MIELLSPDAPVASTDTPTADAQTPPPEKPIKPVEYGGPKGLEPTRYGDWEKGGRCIDF